MLPEKYQVILTEGFITRFYILRGQNPKLKLIEVYNLVEDEYFELTGKNKFTGWDSFRKSLKNFNRKNHG